MNNAKLTRAVLFLVALFVVMTEYSGAQVQWTRQSLTRGKLWATVWNSLQFGEPVAPGNVYYTLDYPGYSKGARVSDALNYAEGVGFSMYGKRNGVASAYTINTRFYASAVYAFATEEATLLRNYNLSDPSNPAEETVIGGQHMNELDVDISQRSMVWSFPRYNSFIIHELTITNTGFTPVTDFIIGMRYGLRMTERSGTYRDEKYGWSDSSKLFFFYDDRSFDFSSEVPTPFAFGVGPLRGDIADARDIREQGTREHELDAPGYFSAICLDSAGGNVYQNIVEYLGQGTTTNAPNEDVMFKFGVDNPDRYWEVMTHQQPRMSWDQAKSAGGEGGNKFERLPEFLLSAGPYTIAPFASVKVVFAEVMGEMDRKKIVEGGVGNIDLLKTASLDSLLANVRAARELYSRNYVPLAFPPPTPTNGENSLAITPLENAVKISWPIVPGTYRDPQKGTNDLAGYKIYRSTYFTIGPWELVVDLPQASATVINGMVEYIDMQVSPGVGYYYTVTAYDLDGNESGKVNNNRFPIYPTRGPNKDFPGQVYAVPNPFRQHSRLLGTGERLRIEFIGLPAQCSIKIYTVAGELVQELAHDDGSGSQAWGSILRLDYQLNRWLLGIAPGIYVYRVESRVPGQEGKIFIGKLAIIK